MPPPIPTILLTRDNIQDVAAALAVEGGYGRPRTEDGAVLLDACLDRGVDKLALWPVIRHDCPTVLLRRWYLWDALSSMNTDFPDVVANLWSFYHPRGASFMEVLPSTEFMTGVIPMHRWMLRPTLENYMFADEHHQSMEDCLSRILVATRDVATNSEHFSAIFNNTMSYRDKKARHRLRLLFSVREYLPVAGPPAVPGVPTR